jgi:Pvc16 N-terminal domain
MLLGVSETLRQYLVGALPNKTVKVGAITDLAGKASAKALMLVLYEVEDVGELRAAPARLAPDAQEPVGLRLQYLVTARGHSAGDLQQSLSLVLDAFHKHPVFTRSELDATIADRVDRLTIQLRSTSLEDLRNLWSAFGAGMQLSLYYEVNAQPPP